MAAPAPGDRRRRAGSLAAIPTPVSSAAALHVAANLVNTENILVDGAGYLKLTDFGFAKELIAVPIDLALLCSG